MKRVIIMMVMLPMFSVAQSKKNEDSNKDSDGKLVLVHADNTVKVPAEKKDGVKHHKDNIKYTGHVQFHIGNNDIKCDSALELVNEDIVNAWNVTISNPSYFTTKGDKLNYNKDTKRGTVTENVTVTALNGNVVGTSESVEVDLKKEAYRIGMGNITPPKQDK